jgi:head-tail adaptor
MSLALGSMRERLVILKNDPPTVSITSITRASTTATVTTAVPHGYATGDYVTVAGATPTGYNGKVKIMVTAPTTFTYTVAAIATPATGTLTVVYTSDAQGGRRAGWTTLDTIAAELIPLQASERLQLAAIHSDIAYRFRVRSRADVSSEQRALWTPTWPAGSARRTLEITGVPPVGDGRTFMYIEAHEALS